MGCLFTTTLILSSCVDDFIETHKPAWLGESIYDQLEQGYTGKDGTVHTFNTYIRLINDIEYKEVLKKTGSKTLFVSDDAAFERFYQSNAWGVPSYDSLSLSQKKLILNSSMINNAYLIELMSSTEGPVEGQALRRNTAFSVLDTICMEKAEDMPLNSNWDSYRAKGYVYLVKDKSSISMVHFLQKQMNFKGMTSDDFSFLYNGQPRSENDAHVFGNKVIERDITCKNGYINVLADVLIPPANMAELIRTTPETKLFSSILERYAAPYYDKGLTNEYSIYREKELQKGYELPIIDSLFRKNYFAERSGIGSNLTNQKGVLQAGYLEFDPGWNTYALNGAASFQTDMGAIFAPADDILNTFFYNGGGKFLIEKYKTIDKIPNDVLDDLLRNLMKASFLGSLPNKFAEVLDDGKEPMGIEKSHVVKTLVGNNGVVYVTNKIYAPASYVAVTAPTLVNDNLRIFRWAVKNLGYDAYLLSMDSRYSFITPSDQTMPENSTMGSGMYYIDPVSLGKSKPEVFKFWYNPKFTKVTATAYLYNKETGVIGDSLRLVTDAEVLDRLDDILDYHIVVGDIENGKSFHRTKGGGELKVVGSGVGMEILGGGNLENATQAVVNKLYDQTKETNGRGNGKTYITNSLLQTPYNSVYKILSETSAFNEFFRLLQGSEIFYRDKSFVGLDYNVKFFNTYHYSVYVPNNEAVLAAIAQGLPTWEIINAQTDQTIKDQMAIQLTNFLRYHFQDNSLYINNTTSDVIPFETAAYRLAGEKSYYKLYTKLGNNGLTLYNDPIDRTNPVNVKTDRELYNIMAREFKFNLGDITKVTNIETSSFAVIHEIDQVLLYDKDLLINLKALQKTSIRRK